MDCSVKDLVTLTADDGKTVAPITVPETVLKAKGSQKTNSTKFLKLEKRSSRDNKYLLVFTLKSSFFSSKILFGDSFVT